jgi:peptide/nickel transport system substrate-binding protein
MRNIRWQILIAVGGLLLVVGLLLGQTPTGEIPAPQPVQGGSYAEAVLGHAARLNPILDFSNQTDRDIDRLIYSGLLEFDSRGLPHPALAERWAVSADATLYTFTLRDDAFWQDGQPVTSDDVVYTFSKFQDKDYPGPSDLHDIWSKVKVVRLDEKSVQFQLPEPFAPFLDYLALGLLPDHLLRGVSAGGLIDHPFNLHPIGSGPFKFDNFLTKDGTIAGVSLTAFEQALPQRPYLDRFEFRFYDDPQAMIEAYKAGEVQGLGGVPNSILGQVLADSGLNLYSARLPRIGLVFLNLKDPGVDFFDDKLFRQALLLAINRQWIADSILSGQAVVADGPILPGTWAAATDLEPRPYDPQAAARMLEDLGWQLPVGAAPGSPEYVRSKDGTNLSFELDLPNDDLHQRLGALLQQSWQAIGIQVTLNPMTPDELMGQALEPRKFQSLLTELNLSRYPDPDPYPFWHDTQIETGQNYGGFSDRNISIWLEQARLTPDIGKRIELYRNFQHRFHDQVPALLLYNPIYDYAVTSDMQGVVVGPLFDPSDRLAGVGTWHLLARRSAAAAQTPTP